MKLLNREPTEEMLEAYGGKLYVFQEMARFIWETAYDAAPEIHIDMQPVAWTALEDKTGMVLLYSAEQVAALQAKIERLNQGWHSANVENIKVTQERNTLLEVCKEGYDFMGACGMEGSIFAEHAQEVIAKYEGEKHD